MSTTKTTTPSVATISFSESWNASWELFKKHWVFLYALGFITAVVSIVIQLGLTMVIDTEDATMSLMLQLFMFVVNGIITLGTLDMVLRLVKGEPVNRGQFFDKINRTPDFLWLQFKTGLLVFVGFLCLLVPGIVLALKYSFAPFFLIDKGGNAGDAMKASAQMTEGVKLQLFFFGIMMAFVNFAGLLLLGLGLLITVPVTSLMYFHLYLRLRSKVDLATLK